MIVVVDTSLLFYRHVFVMASTIGDHVFDMEEKWQIELRKRAFNSILYDINQYGNNIDHLILACDEGKSWRHDLKEQYHEIEYKGHRKSNKKSLNLSLFNRCIDIFCAEMEIFGMCTIKYDTMEGDDIIYMVTKQFYDKGIPSIIITSDKDFIQLVKIDDTHNNFITVYDGANKKKWHYVNSSFLGDIEDKASDPMDIFSTKVVMQHPGLEKVKKYHQIVDNRRSLMRKIMIGDTSDNVPPAMTFNIKTKVHKFSDINVKNTINDNPWILDIDPVELWDSRDLKLKLAKAMFNSKKNCDDYRSIERGVEGIRRNMMYMWLNKAVYNEYNTRLYHEVWMHVKKSLADADYFGDYHKPLQNGELTDGTIYFNETKVKYF
jgi:5'-3' exonuclease